MALTKITPQMFDTSATAHDLNVDNGTFVVDGSASRVGIGTATPSTLLDVNGTATATTFVGALTGNVTGNLTGTILTAAQTNITSVGTLSALAVNSGTTNTVATFTSSDAGAGINLTDNSGTSTLQTNGANLRIGVDEAGAVSSSAIQFRVDGSTKATIDSGGNVSILTSGVALNAPVLQTTNADVATYTGTSPAIHSPASATMAFSMGGAERMRITSAGLVGIGRTPAFASLEVEGDKTLANSLQLQLNGATNTNKQMIIGFDTNTDESHIISQIAGSALKPLIISASRVGIGASSMTATRPFHVKTGFNSTGAIGATFENTDTNGSSWIQLAGNGTAGSFQIGASLGKLRFYDDGTSSQMLDITAAGALLAGAGSASLPSLSFIGDPNTGIYNLAGDNLGFAIGGVSKGFWSATQFNVTGNGVFSGTGSFGGNLSVTGDGDFSSEVKVGSNNSLFAENVIRFYSAGAAYFDHGTVGQNINFRVGNGSALNTTALTLTSTGLSYFPYFLGVRASTRWNGSAPSYALTISADNSGNAIEVYRTSNSKMLQYMSADGKYYFDMYGNNTPEIKFRNNGTDWMRTQGTHLYVGGSTTQTLGAGTSASGTGSNQTILQVQGAVDMGYHGRYTHGLWGPATVASSGRYTHLRTAMWGGGSPHGNTEYIMGGFLITGYRYQGTANHRALHQFHNWNGTMYNKSSDNLIDGGGWTGASNVYVDSTGYVTIVLDSQSSNYRMYYVEYIQYNQYNKISAEITAITVSNSATI